MALCQWKVKFALHVWENCLQKIGERCEKGRKFIGDQEIMVGSLKGGHSDLWMKILQKYERIILILPKPFNFHS